MKLVIKLATLVKALARMPGRGRRQRSLPEQTTAPLSDDPLPVVERRGELEQTRVADLLQREIDKEQTASSE